MHYDKNDGYADSKTRIYLGEISDMGEGTTHYILKSQEGTSDRIVLHTQFYPDYMMGDPTYDYFDDEAFQPKIYYYDSEEQEYDDEETLLAQGVKLISFEYPTPIENSLVFSHISYCSGEVVLPTTLIAVLALLAIIVFVKKEKDLERKAIDIISIVLNFVIGFTYVPFIAILAMFIDIEGGGPEFYYQVMYFIPALSVLSIGASVALRRKGNKIISLIFGLVGPALFGVYLIVCSIMEIL